MMLVEGGRRRRKKQGQKGKGKDARKYKGEVRRKSHQEKEEWMLRKGERNERKKRR